MGFAARFVRRSPHDRDDVSVQSLRRVRRRRSALLCGALSARLAIAGAARGTLVEIYDVDWWRNPRAGPWICSALFSEGQRELAHEQAQRVAGKALSFAPLIRSVERMLG